MVGIIGQDRGFGFSVGKFFSLTLIFTGVHFLYPNLMMAELGAGNLLSC
jgi:hypothetical protein